MNDERLKTSEPDSNEARRNFLRKSGRVAMAAPAVALLLAAGSKSSFAQAQPYRPPPTDTTVN
jgi:hypothetical protein